VERVESAEQMFDACTRKFPEVDIAVMAAANLNTQFNCYHIAATAND